MPNIARDCTNSESSLDTAYQGAAMIRISAGCFPWRSVRAVEIGRWEDGVVSRSIQTLTLDKRITSAELIRRSDGILKHLIASVRQIAANGGFTFGPIRLQDPDLNRIHAIVTEIDSRRLFYACREDEIPRFVMASLYEVRSSIRETSKGVWANPSCEVLVQEIVATLNDFCTETERMDTNNLAPWTEEGRRFYRLLTDMRLNVWLLIAMIKKKIGSTVNPRNMPAEILEEVAKNEI